jgi:hypothetical protein
MPARSINASLYNVAGYAANRKLTEVVFHELAYQIMPDVQNIVANVAKRPRFLHVGVFGQARVRREALRTLIH